MRNYLSTHSIDPLPHLSTPPNYPLSVSIELLLLSTHSVHPSLDASTSSVYRLSLSIYSLDLYSTFLHQSISRYIYSLSLSTCSIYPPIRSIHSLHLFTTSDHPLPPSIHSSTLSRLCPTTVYWYINKFWIYYQSIWWCLVWGPEILSELTRSLYSIKEIVRQHAAVIIRQLTDHTQGLFRGCVNSWTLKHFECVQSNLLVSLFINCRKSIVSTACREYRKIISFIRVVFSIVHLSSLISAPAWELRPSLFSRFSTGLRIFTFLSTIDCAQYVVTHTFYDSRKILAVRQKLIYLHLQDRTAILSISRMTSRTSRYT